MIHDRITRRINQGYLRVLTQQVSQLVDGGVVVEFGAVAASELVQPGGVVVPPGARRRTWRDVLEPSIQLCAVTGNSAGPEPVDEYSVAIVCGRGVVDPFDLQLTHPRLRWLWRRGGTINIPSRYLPLCVAHAVHSDSDGNGPGYSVTKGVSTPSGPTFTTAPGEPSGSARPGRGSVKNRALVDTGTVHHIDARLCDHIRHGPISSIYYGNRKDSTPFYRIGGLMGFVAAVQVAVAFTWLGMVLGISFLEAPLKFRAPGITVPLGVGIGRLVFRALNIVEGVFGAALLVAAALTVPQASTWSGGLIVAVVITLVVGAWGLRPRMDARVRRGNTVDGLPRHVLHIGYVVLECVKVLLLLAIGIVGLLA